MGREDNFSSYNPVNNFVFFIGAIAFGTFFTQPLYLACALAFSFAYYFTVTRRKGLRFFAGMIPLFVVLSALSPLFNPNGQTVLFTWLGGRPYTLEALQYGMALAGTFIAVLTWFASYNRVMTSDKFTYVFGRAAPAVSLVLSMILRLVPAFRRKLEQIASARKCVGKAGDAGSKREKLDNAMTLISSLTTWALEGGVVTADSMRSRGYGSGRRSSFAIYRFDGRDRVLLIIMIILIAAVLACNVIGGSFAVSVGAAAYAAFLAIPTAINITEEIVWRILRSRI